MCLQKPRVQLFCHYLFSYDANVDHTMFVLKMLDENKTPLGMIRYISTYQL